MTTARQIFEAVLIETSKVQAPTLKLYEFNHLCNKAIQQYVNKIYNIYDTSQQTSDDLLVLKTTISKTPTKISDGYYEVLLPSDYLHLLNCICTISPNCGDVPATKATPDSWAQIITDVYNRPSARRPYYCLNSYSIKQESEDEAPKQDLIKGNSFKLIKPPADELGNGLVQPIETRCEIRCGKGDLTKVSIDYIKTPKVIYLTQDQLDKIQDTSQIMEFPDYVNQQIIDELVHLVLERSSDPRLTTHYQITQSIAKPTQQQAQTQAQA